MAEKILITDSNLGLDPLGSKYLQILVGNAKEETLYSEFQSIDEESGKITYDTHELAVDINDVIKIRDFLNGLIKKMAGE